LVKAKALDVLHDVVEHAIVLAHAVHGNYVGVVHAGGRFRLALEALLLLGIQHRLDGQHLEGNVAAQRFLLGLVDDAHAASANLAQDAEVAQPFQRLPPSGKNGAGADAARQVADFTLQVFNHHDRWIQLLKFSGDLWVLGGVLAQFKPLAAQQTLAPFRHDLADKTLVRTR
jgi:hypothetical protein